MRIVSLYEERLIDRARNAWVASTRRSHCQGSTVFARCYQCLTCCTSSDSHANTFPWNFCSVVSGIKTRPLGSEYKFSSPVQEAMKHANCTCAHTRVYICISSQSTVMISGDKLFLLLIFIFR